MDTYDDEPQRGDAGGAEGGGGVKWLNSGSDPTTDVIIGCALHVHRTLGPGLLESVYLECLAIELSEAGLPFRREVPLSMRYRGRDISVRYRLDLVAAESVVVEVKSVERLLPLHRAQLLTYLRLGEYSRGLLINFGVMRLKDGIQRVVNGWVPVPGLTKPQRGSAEPAEGRGG
jgi:GxxExxY protein